MAGTNGQAATGKDKYYNIMDVAAPIAGAIASSYGQNGATAAQIGLNAYNNSRNRYDQQKELQRQERQKVELGKRIASLSDQFAEKDLQTNKRLYDYMKPDTIKAAEKTQGTGQRLMQPSFNAVSGETMDYSTDQPRIDQYVSKNPEPVKDAYYKELGEIGMVDPQAGLNLILDRSKMNQITERRIADLSFSQKQAEAANEFQRQRDAVQHKYRMEETQSKDDKYLDREENRYKLMNENNKANNKYIADRTERALRLNEQYRISKDRRDAKRAMAEFSAASNKSQKVIDSLNSMLKKGDIYDQKEMAKVASEIAKAEADKEYADKMLAYLKSSIDEDMPTDPEPPKPGQMASSHSGQKQYVYDSNEKLVEVR